MRQESRKGRVLQPHNKIPTTRLARDTETIDAAAGADGHAEGGEGGGVLYTALICCMTNVLARRLR